MGYLMSFWDPKQYTAKHRNNPRKTSRCLETYVLKPIQEQGWTGKAGSESIEWFKRTRRKFWLLPASCHRVVSLSQSSCVSPAELTDGRRGRRRGGGLGRSQSIRRRKSLVLYKSLNTLWAG
jgi:hypothetical protein